MAACSLNPVLCANQVAIWVMETIGAEAMPAAGLGISAAELAKSLSKAQLKELSALMAMEKSGELTPGLAKKLKEFLNKTPETNIITKGTSVVAQGETKIVESSTIAANTTVKLTENVKLPNGEVIPKGSLVTVNDNTMKVTYPDGTSKISNYDKAKKPTSELPDINAGKESVATNNINQSLKLGETRVVNGVSITRVGRWMFPEELAQMQSTGKVIQGGGG